MSSSHAAQLDAIPDNYIMAFGGGNPCRSVFIALIAQAYENAREDLQTLQKNAIARTPALGDPDRVAKDTLLAKNNLRNMAHKKIVSEPLTFALREPLLAVETTMIHTHGNLFDLAAPKTSLDRMLWSKFSSEARIIDKLSRVTKNLMTTRRVAKMMCGSMESLCCVVHSHLVSFCHLPLHVPFLVCSSVRANGVLLLLPGPGVDRSMDVFKVESIRDAAAATTENDELTIDQDAARLQRRQEKTKKAHAPIADLGITLSHPIDTFTDDDDDPTFDELKDLFGDAKNAHLFERDESRCRVTIFAVRNIRDIGVDDVIAKGRVKRSGSGNNEFPLAAKGTAVYVEVFLVSDAKQPQTRRSATQTLDATASTPWNFGEVLCSPCLYRRHLSRVTRTPITASIQK